MAEYIEREAMLNRLKPDDQGDEESAVLLSDVRKILRDFVMSVPAADVAPVGHAKWIDGADSFGAKRGQFRVCSRCNICFPRDDRIVRPAYWQGCPNCMARMDGE